MTELKIKSKKNNRVAIGEAKTRRDTSLRSLGPNATDFDSISVFGCVSAARHPRVYVVPGGPERVTKAH